MLKSTAIVLCVFLVSCILRGNKETLQEALTKYNAAARWGWAEWMAEHVPKEKRSSFARTTDFGELQITACEVGAVRMKGKGEAEAMVQVNWYMKGQGRLRTSYISQEWKHDGGGWLIMKQRLVRGAPFPLLVQTDRSRSKSMLTSGRPTRQDRSSDAPTSVATSP